MKKTLLFTFIFLFSTFLFAQKTNDNGGNGSNTPNNSNNNSSDIEIDHFIIGGSLGLGPILSTNLVNTGFIGESTIDFMVQMRHHRFGLGITNTLMGTPENLATLLFTLGKDNVNLHKGYFIYEWSLFRRSPINVGAGAKLGAFTVGNYPDTTKSTLFISAGPYVELGAPGFLLFVKPEIGYNSYDTGSWKKDLFVIANIGFRWKIMTEEEKKRKQDKKKKRKK